MTEQAHSSFQQDWRWTGCHGLEMASIDHHCYSRSVGRAGVLFAMDESWTPLTMATVNKSWPARGFVATSDRPNPRMCHMQHRVACDDKGFSNDADPSDDED